VTGIPTLVLLDGNGQTLHEGGRQVVADFGAAGFPWNGNPMTPEEVALAEAEAKAKAAQEAAAAHADAISKLKERKDQRGLARPQYFLSIKSSSTQGIDFSYFSREFELSNPELAVTRGALLEYFTAHEKRAQQGIFQFRSQMNASFVLDKRSGTASFIKKLCTLLGIDLNPPEQGSVDDSKSFIENIADQLTNQDEKHPFVRKLPEFGIYRDLTLFFKMMVADTTHNRSVKLLSYEKNSAKLRWTVLGPNPRRTACNIMVRSGFEVRHVPDISRQLRDMRAWAWMLDRTEVASAANIRTYLTAFKNRAETESPSEDDVLHELTLPDFSDRLSEEDSEKLLSYLTVPYLRLPLVMSFFSSKDHVNLLLSKDLQNVLQSVIFEPGNWISKRETETITQVPLPPEKELQLIGATDGLLANELVHAPDAFLNSLLEFGKLVLMLNTGSYKSATVDIILFAVRLISRIEQFLVYAMDLAVQTNRKTHLENLMGHRDRLRKFMIGTVRAVLLDWERQCRKDNELNFSCVLAAHVVLLYRSVRDNEMTAADVGPLLSRLVYIQTWYSPGRDAESPLNPHARKAQKADLFEAESKRVEEEKKKLKSIGKTEHEKAEEKEKEELVGQAPLLVPDQEIFDVLQAKRRGFVKWFEKASDDDRDNVLEQSLAAATRNTHTCETTGWKPKIGFTIWKLPKEDIEINVQTAEVFLGVHRIKPVSNRIARNEDYIMLFGKEPQHCASVATHENRKWIRLVGRNYNLKYWRAPKWCMDPMLALPEQLPRPWDSVHWTGAPAFSKAEGWRCYQCSHWNPYDAPNCTNEQKPPNGCSLFPPPPMGPGPRPAPISKDGWKFDGKDYGRLFIKENIAPHEQWLFDILEPVLAAIYDPHPIKKGECFREKMRWELFLPTESLEPDAKEVQLFGLDYNPKEKHKSTWKNVIVLRDRAVVHLYVLLEHGRRLYRSLSFTSNSRFCHHNLQPDTGKRKKPWHPAVRHATGSFKLDFPMQATLVISRIHPATKENETFIPARLLHGLIPSALLENFIFWQRKGDHSLRGYPKDMKDSRWHYKCRVHILKFEGKDGNSSWRGVVSQLPLAPGDFLAEAERTGQRQEDMQFQGLTKETMLSIQKDKVIAIVDGLGVSEFVATKALAMFNDSLEAAESYLQDPANEAEIKALQQEEAKDKQPSEDAPKTVLAKQISHMEAASLARQISEEETKASHRMVLLDLLHSPIPSTCGRISSVIARIEDLSHVLCWTTQALEEAGGEVTIAFVELPRLKLKFKPQMDGDGITRLYSVDHDGLFISDYHLQMPQFKELTSGLPYSVLMENRNRELFLLVPNVEVERPVIYDWPFSVELIPMRSSEEWMDIMDPRFFLYSIHPSHTYLITPTQSSAVYLIVMLLLARQYQEAFRVVQSCEADRPLSSQEKWVMNELKKCEGDFHPDIYACRLKLSLVTMHCKEKYPWEIQEEYKEYLHRLGLVSKVCCLSADEEVYLLKHIQSGAAELGDVKENWQGLKLDQPQLESELNNRLVYLQRSMELMAEPKVEGKEEKTPALLLEKVWQKGFQDPWSKVRQAVPKFFEKKDGADRSWASFAQYKQPAPEERTGAGAIKKMKYIWDDEITGQAANLGFMFCLDLMTGRLRMSLTGDGRFESKTLGILCARLLFGANTNWGRISNLQLHRSRDDLSFVPYIMLAILDVWPSKEDFPEFEYKDHAFALRNGMSTTSHTDDPNNAPRARALCDYIEVQVIPWCEKSYQSEFWMMASMNEEAMLAIGEDIRNTRFEPVPMSKQIGVPISVLDLLEVSNYSLESRQVRPFQHDQVALSEEDVSSLSTFPLRAVDFKQYVTVLTNEQKVSHEVPFDISKNEDAQAIVAKKLLHRLENDLKLYAASINEGKTPRLLGLLDADLEKFTQAKAKEVEGKDVETKDDPTVSPAVEKLFQDLINLLKDLLLFEQRMENSFHCV